MTTILHSSNKHRELDEEELNTKGNEEDNTGISDNEESCEIFLERVEREQDLEAEDTDTVDNTKDDTEDLITDDTKKEEDSESNNKKQVQYYKLHKMTKHAGDARIALIWDNP
eukprot:8063401-Ditylum_brightwellii.AAC.1